MGEPRKGKYKPVNPDKYVGDIKNIVYRSGWEKKFCKLLDNRDDILKWASEPFPILYMSPLDKRPHRYFPDFLIKYKDKTGKLKVTLIEIKPFRQTQPPKERKRKSKLYLEECAVYVTNMAKWEAARAFCTKKGWNFQVITEKEMNF